MLIGPQVASLLNKPFHSFSVHPFVISQHKAHEMSFDTEWIHFLLFVDWMSAEQDITSHEKVDTEYIQSISIPRCVPRCVMCRLYFIIQSWNKNDMVSKRKPTTVLGHVFQCICNGNGTRFAEENVHSLEMRGKINDYCHRCRISLYIPFLFLFRGIFPHWAVINMQQSVYCVIWCDFTGFSTFPDIL